MKPDRRLVKDIQHSRKSATDLRGKPYPLRFAARKRRGGAGKRKIIEPDVYQKFQPCADFFDYPFGNERFLFVKNERAEKFVDFFHRHIRKFRNVKPADSDRERFLFQAFSAARFARHGHHISFDFVLNAVACRFAIAAHKVVDDTFVFRHKLPAETA